MITQGRRKRAGLSGIVVEEIGRGALADWTLNLKKKKAKPPPLSESQGRNFTVQGRGQIRRRITGKVKDGPNDRVNLGLRRCAAKRQAKRAAGVTEKKRHKRNKVRLCRVRK